MQRLAMSLAYQGSAYYGWQAQIDSLPSVQRTVEKALSQVANHPILVSCAGRTDRGVHALKQVIHFETNAVRELWQWHRGTNFFLPKDIRVRHVEWVDGFFHARFSARSRQYHYVIYNHEVELPFVQYTAAWQRQPLNILTMQEAASCLLGEHDFSAFRGRDCQARSPVKTLHNFSVQQQGCFITITLHANAFLQHMVRNIVGCLLDIGGGKRHPQWLKTVLESKDRRCAGAMAAPHGLYLSDVFYPEPYNFPVENFFDSRLCVT